MKRSSLLFFLFLFSCNDPQPKKNEKDFIPTANIPKPNTVVASDSIRIPDALNELYFSIEVIATDQSANGVYEVLVAYGYNDASTQITMPEADQPIIPEVRKGKEPFSYIIGFRYGKDTSFNDYFLVHAAKNQTVMKYLKAYSFK